MIKIEKSRVSGWEEAIRGMRNPMNSWDKSDSEFFVTHCAICTHKCVQKELQRGCLTYRIGEKDLDLMKKLASSGTDHRKFMRFIQVSFDIIAPLYFLKEFDTYRFKESNSCSTMHKLMDREILLDDFSHDKLTMESDMVLVSLLKVINAYREKYLETYDKSYWYQIIQLLPSSYNQRRTILLNYETLANIYKSRKKHRLQEWRTFCKWIESLPYFKEIMGIEEDVT